MLTQETPLVLGSGSPRRIAFLSELKIPCVVFPPHVDETPLTKEPASAYVARIARAKLQAVALSLAEPCPFAGILVADTTVSVEERILGKPANEEDSLSMIQSLVGRTHQVLTAYALRSLITNEEIERTVRTDVEMRAVGEEELRQYVRTGEGLDKAGAYAIQGRAAAFVRRIEGSYTNVVGLPLCEIVDDLRALGLLWEGL